MSLIDLLERYCADLRTVKHVFTKAELDKLLQDHDYSLGSSTYGDFCYDRWNKGIALEGKWSFWEKDKKLFLFIRDGEYEFVGRRYKYTGPVWHFPQRKISEKRIVGEFVDGKVAIDVEDEAPFDSKTFIEGKESIRQITVRSRSGAARKVSITHWGAACWICDFDFEKIYGPRGEGFIVVHHLIEIAKRDGEYEIDPKSELRPICPNCHAMLHRSPPIDIEELREEVQHRKLAHRSEQG